MNKIYSLFLIIVISGCGAGGSGPFNNAAFNITTDRHLYVASGTCYGGGVTTSAGPANTIAKFNLSTGAFEQLVIDYNRAMPGDSPVAIADYDSTHLLVLVENASGRRVDLVNKDGSGSSIYLVNNTGLSAALRSLAFLSDMSILVSKSTAIEKFNSSKVRMTIGANPWVNAPAGACAASATLISSVIVHPSGRIVYTHAAATPNNRIGVIGPLGYSAAADCQAAQTGPATTALPTHAIFHSSGKLMVTYGSTTAASNSVYQYDFDGATGAISNAQSLFGDSTVVNGPSSLVEDQETQDVYVANVTSTFNTIERFHYDGSAFTRATTAPFIPPSAYTRCVSDMKVTN